MTSHMIFPVRTNNRRSARLQWVRALSVVSIGTVVAAGCTSDSMPQDAAPALPTIVVSNVVLASVVTEVAGSAADVVVLIPNGVDPHLFEPSAKDIEQLNNADLVVINGLGLESKIEDSLAGVRAKGIPIFEATDHIETHEASKSDDHATSDVHEGEPESDVHAGHSDHEGEVESDVHADEEQVEDHDEHMHSDDDPHFWTDPRLMAEVVLEIGEAVTDLGLDIGDRALMFSERILTFDQDMLRRVETLPVESRILVTGHESLGYFAERYGFDIVGTIIPGLSSGAEVSAGNLAEVKEAVSRTGVGVIFTELGTSSASARVLSNELGVEVVEISTHLLPEEAVELGGAGETYLEFIELLVDTIVSALQE